nr:Ig-like domain-containing protein [uncultured Ruminococcus sp.]
MKKTLSLIMSVLMLLSAFSMLSVSAVETNDNTEETTTVNGVVANVGDTVTIDYFVKSDCIWEDFQGHVTYDYEGLQVESFEMPDVTAGVMTNTSIKGFAYYTGVDINSNYKFYNEVNFYRIKLTVLKAGNYTVDNVWEVADGNGVDMIVDKGIILNPDRLLTREVVTVTPKPTEPTTTTSEPTTVSETEPTTTTSEPTTVSETEPTTTTSEPTTVSETEPTTTTSEPTTVSETEPTTTTSEPTTVSETEPTTTTSEPTTVSKTEPTTVNAIPSTIPTTTKPVVKKVSKVGLSKKSVTLIKGRNTTIKAKVSPTNATNKKLKWTTSNAKVATVNQSGKITAKGKGTATIKVRALDGSNKYATCKVTVKQPVTSIKLNKKTVTLKAKGSAKQKTATLRATVSPKNANNKKVKWTSSKSKIATVNSKGKVTAKKKGTCYVIATAKDGSKKSAKCKIVVK